MLKFCWFIFGFMSLFLIALTPAQSAEMLLNRSFETPVVPNFGNNFYTTLPNWIVVSSPAIVDHVNLIKPNASYTGGPTAPPTGGGTQYFDINSSGGTVTQSVTFPTSGVVSIRGWFSVRDSARNLTGGGISLINPSNATVASASVSFVVSDPFGTWKQASTSSIAVSAGTYQFRVTMDDFHNVDLMSLDYIADAPALVIDKSANTAGPLVVGNTVTYTYTVRNSGNVALANVNINDIHSGTGTAPVIGGEVLLTDLAPTGDTTDPAIANPALANGIWSTLGVGDTIRFTASYLVTQQDIDTLQ